MRIHSGYFLFFPFSSSISKLPYRLNINLGIKLSEHVNDRQHQRMYCKNCTNSEYIGRFRFRSWFLKFVSSVDRRNGIERDQC